MKGDTMSGEVQSGFTIWELFAILVVVVVLVIIFLPAMGSPRINTNGNESRANLRTLTMGAANYAGDSDEEIFYFKWTKESQYISLRSISDNLADPNQSSLASRGAQAENILMRATGRIKGGGAIQNSWMMNVSHRYSHLVLLDYLTDRQPEPIMASPFDKNLINWQENPLGYLDADSDVPYGKGMPSEAGYDTDPMWLEDSVKQLWAFGSSYQVVPHAWLDDVDPQYTPSAESPHHLVKGESEEPLGGRRMTEVKFPSQKVFMYEEFDRFSDPKGIYAAYPEAKVNLAFFDGSVRQEETSDARSAYDEKNPTRVWEQRYVPLDTFPVPMGGLGELKKWDLRFRWTKGGLSGIDYN